MDDSATPRLTARRLFDGGRLRIDHVVATATSELPTPVRASRTHLLVLPYAGIFATHFGGRNTQVTGANQALVVPADIEHRYSYPGLLGDRCLALTWTDEDTECARPAALLLTPAAMLDRERLRALLKHGDADVLAVDECVSRLRTAVVHTAWGRERDAPATRRAALRCRRALVRVQAAIAADPAHRWTLDELAAIAALSPHHLTHVFTREVGTSLYEYVTRARLGAALASLLGSDSDLATVAADAGFASHSHFTARFKARFGVTPQSVRHTTGIASPHRRRIVTAEQRRVS